MGTGGTEEWNKTLLNKIFCLSQWKIPRANFVCKRGWHCNSNGH